MKYFSWDEKKNEKLKIQREISFEDIQTAIDEGKLLAIIQNPNRDKYPNQEIFVIEINNYVYLVPYIKDDEKYFLKTIFPSRKMTKKYLIERRRK